MALTPCVHAHSRSVVYHISLNPRPWCLANVPNGAKRCSERVDLLCAAPPFTGGRGDAARRDEKISVKRRCQEARRGREIYKTQLRIAHLPNERRPGLGNFLEIPRHPGHDPPPGDGYAAGAALRVLQNDHPEGQVAGRHRARAQDQAAALAHDLHHQARPLHERLHGNADVDHRVSQQTQGQASQGRPGSALHTPSHFSGLSDHFLQAPQRLLAQEQALEQVHRRIVPQGGRQPYGTPAAHVAGLGPEDFQGRASAGLEEVPGPNSRRAAQERQNKEANAVHAYGHRHRVASVSCPAHTSQVAVQLSLVVRLVAGHAALPRLVGLQHLEPAYGRLLSWQADRQSCAGGGATAQQFNETVLFCLVA
ncbi:hypothetical protein KL930_001491 [Ogataea haglerorum]|uniref:Uncharacterized protein n=1 Tax=Ogataea haglerorum TaxID=1937702 RepID=A0ABQ7RAT8_9ASCO|nr:uncharacterized protein KL911_004337 [Ogataea haglerorum]KAG7692146.1 hypothetical protein KL915_004906 [Ogataea haglerorum]KAG7698713.1 hypothetical protein KL951_001977 [Ogataea haglerorum]KAG7703601.1 hypothetical protein KL914_004558 [Ogataea haglerorum]KAG7704152.1 hypothetical protein KL950_004479 [Ogataea haglerorum]KAG7713947.1 hypothetical protein KL913_004638 [Ogataea haglerorum]